MLYTLTSTNKVHYWSVKVEQVGEAAYIIRDYGALGGKAIVNRKQVLVAKSQKTLFDQAVFEARKDWNDKQKKCGYTTEPPGEAKEEAAPTAAAPNEAATRGARRAFMSEPEESEKLDAGTIKRLAPVTTGASEELGAASTTISAGREAASAPVAIKFLPMLANKFLERKKYVKYPCIAQPKIDGVRHSARLVGNAAELHTRRDTLSPFFQEIKDAVARLNPSVNVILDGELCSTMIPFRTLNGHCNRKTTGGKHGFDTIPPEVLASIHYHLFDCYFINEPAKPFVERYAYLAELMSHNSSPLLELVPNVEIAKEEEVAAAHDQFVAQGFEGAIIRNKAGRYKLKDRSNDLLKFKTFQDAEFEVVGATAPENGKEEGCIIWELKVPNSEETFTCRPEGSYEERKDDWALYQADQGQFLRRLYTVKFQETYSTGIPRFPVGKGFRSETDL